MLTFPTCLESILNFNRLATTWRTSPPFCFTISLAYLFSSYLLTMKDQANSGVTENPGASDLPVTSELKAMLAEPLEGAKKDILSNVQESIDQIYANFDYVESESEGP